MSTFNHRIGLYLIALVGILLTSCDDRPITQAIKIERPAFKQIIAQPAEDKVEVINFWATWCAPCVEELPAFEKISTREDVEVKLISLDDPKTMQTAVQTFLEQHEIKSAVYVLDDAYAAEYLPIVDPHWDGSIPVTLIKYKNRKRFYNKAFTYTELKDAVAKIKP